jgi:hypothetical protein
MSQKNESTASPTKQKKLSPAKSANGASSAADIPRGAMRSVMSEHGTPMSISPQERRQMVSESAYYRAEQLAFCGEGQFEDWLAAEAEINTRFPVQ